MSTKKPWSWTCPHCDRPQVVTSNADSIMGRNAFVSEKYKIVVPVTHIISCANEKCLELTIISTINRAAVQAGAMSAQEELIDVGRVPAAHRIPQPDFIPEPLREDYYEACAIEHLSPKASATLLRRCIQGMIRDFCKISKHSLADEITELRKQVQAGTAPPGVLADVLDAIDNARLIGNIGAHMERDINVIIDIDPGEARTLRKLVELLFKEWYVARHERQARIADVAGVQAAKAAQKQLPPPNGTTSRT